MDSSLSEAHKCVDVILQRAIVALTTPIAVKKLSDTFSWSETLRNTPTPANALKSELGRYNSLGTAVRYDDGADSLLPQSYGMKGLFVGNNSTNRRFACGPSRESKCFDRASNTGTLTSFGLPSPRQECCDMNEVQISNGNGTNQSW